MKFYRPSRPIGATMLFGLAEVVSGLVKLLTFGMFASTISLDVARRNTQREFKQWIKKP